MDTAGLLVPGTLRHRVAKFLVVQMMKCLIGIGISILFIERVNGVIEGTKLLRYSMQLSMLKQLLIQKLIDENEYQLIKKKLMKDYGVVSNITA